MSDGPRPHFTCLMALGPRSHVGWPSTQGHMSYGPWPQVTIIMALSPKSHIWWPLTPGHISDGPSLHLQLILLLLCVLPHLKQPGLSKYFLLKCEHTINSRIVYEAGQSAIMTRPPAGEVSCQAVVIWHLAISWKINIKILNKIYGLISPKIKFNIYGSHIYRYFCFLFFLVFHQ